MLLLAIVRQAPELCVVQVPLGVVLCIPCAPNALIIYLQQGRLLRLACVMHCV